MKPARKLSTWIGCGVALAAFMLASSAQAAIGKAVVRAVRGTASYSEQAGDWKPLKAGLTLQPGSSLRTGVASQVDLFLGDNGPDVTLFEQTTLGLDKLSIEQAGPEKVIETMLDLRQGTIRGVVNRLTSPSRYEVKTPNSVAAIKGTEYQISADSVVHVIHGSVLIAYTNPSTKVVSTSTVNEGMTFMPPTNPAAPGAQPRLVPTSRDMIQPLKPIVPPTEREPVVAARTEGFVSPIASGSGSAR
jgi:FecR protein